MAYAPFAELLVIDIDGEELGKFKDPRYRTHQADLRSWTLKQQTLPVRPEWDAWTRSLAARRASTDSGSSAAVPSGALNPYQAVAALQSLMPKGSIVAADCGANLCWVYQEYLPDTSFLFTAAGNSPMGYSLPAAIGAQLARPRGHVWCFIGDGGLQMNIQELQSVVHYRLPIVIVVLNNQGYGIIKQFQDAYFEGRYEASGLGYSVPDFEKVVTAYGVDFLRVTTLGEIAGLRIPDGPVVIEVVLPAEALIAPKVEVDRFLHDPFPYNENGIPSDLPYDYPRRPSELGGANAES